MEEEGEMAVDVVSRRNIVHLFDWYYDVWNSKMK
jgi:hypothetical protein